jgi:hypothetical protein
MTTKHSAVACEHGQSERALPWTEAYHHWHLDRLRWLDREERRRSRARISRLEQCDLCCGPGPVEACPVCGRVCCDTCEDGFVCVDCAETIDEETDEG